MLDSSIITEVEARNIRTPELDAEAPGPHILEIETLEPVPELEAPNQGAEMGGWGRSVVASFERQNGQVAGL